MNTFKMSACSRLAGSSAIQAMSCYLPRPLAECLDLLKLHELYQDLESRLFCFLRSTQSTHGGNVSGQYEWLGAILETIAHVSAW